MRFERFRARDVGPFKGEVDVDLSAIDGQLIAVTGKNGAGKSSLLELLAGSLFRRCPTRGTLADLATSRDSYVETSVVNGHAWTLRHTLDNVSGKGEALVLDGAGASVLADTKVRSFDEWRTRKLVTEDVLYSSSFSAQGSGGFVALKATERKATLLRVLGIERLERLAASARERARGAAAEVAQLRARIEESTRRQLDVQAAQAACDQALATEESRRQDVLVAMERLADVASEAARVTAILDAEKARQRRMSDLSASIAAERRRLVDLDGRIANNAAILQRSDEIAAAVARTREIDARYGELREELAGIEQSESAASKELGECHARFSAVEKRRISSMERMKLATDRLNRRAEVDAAVDRSVVLDAEIADAEAKEKALESAHLELAGRRVDGAEDRIAHLRRAIQHIGDNAHIAYTLSRRTLEADDRTVAESAGLPGKLSAAFDRRVAQSAATTALRKEKRRIDEVAALAPTVAIARDDQARAVQDVNAAIEELKRERNTRESATHLLNQLRGLIVARRSESTRLGAERDALVGVTALAERLATAHARLSELRTTKDASSELVSGMESERASIEASVPAGSVWPAMPDADAARAAVASAEQAHARARFEVESAARGYAEAVAAASRIADLKTGLAAAADGLADWTKLGDDLGKDGLIAAEVDCVGPELTTLANDLLHTCVGPRWTVSIETQRTSSDGKKQIEGCEVRVLDTESGREAEVETFSGGERVMIGEAIALALSMLACRRSGLEGVTLVRDESGAALDPSNARAYVAMLRRAATLVGARHVLFVSHSREVQDLADARIEIANGKVAVHGAA